MRYIEVVNAKADLENGTLIRDFENNCLLIHGKGSGGLSKLRTTPFSKDDQRVLKIYLKWRKRKGVKSEWLFFNQYGVKFSDHAGHFNEWLRNQGREYGFSTKEVKLLTTHKIGRHGYGTDQTLKSVPEELIRQNMGLSDTKILKRYQDITVKRRVEETLKRMNPHQYTVNHATEPSNGKENAFTDEERKRRLIDHLITGAISENTFKIALSLLPS